MRRKLLSLAVAAAFCFECCSRPEGPAPENLISPDSMVAILVDVHLAEAVSSITRISDVLRFSGADLYPVIFKTHNTDSAAFRISFNYYLEHPKKLDKIYEQVLNELSRKESETELK